MSEKSDQTTPVNKSFPKADSRRWLLTESRRLLEHYSRSQVPGGFGSLDAIGHLHSNKALTIITARMVHSYSVAALMGVPGAASVADHGLAALLDGPLRDPVHDGWFDIEGETTRKQAYVHAFVGLAAASAAIAGRPRSEELLEGAIAVIEKRFWLAGEAVMAPSFAADWSDIEPYRGANANMHATEAFLAMADATGDDLWLDRAVGLARRFGHDIARANDYALPEHFDADWNALPEFNRDRPMDDLRPWGTTPGHSAEWGGLLLKVEAALLARGREVPDWLLEDGKGFFDSAMKQGWNIDGAPGMVYTIGWNREVSVASRPWWVQAEAANAAWMLFLRTGEKRFGMAYQMIWDYIAEVFIGPGTGGWHQEADWNGSPAPRVYPRPDDLYHAFQALVTPLIPVSASLAGGVAKASPADGLNGFRGDQ